MIWSRSHGCIIIGFHVSFLNETGAPCHPTLSSLPKASGHICKEGNRREAFLVHLADVECTQLNETREGYISDSLVLLNNSHLNRSPLLNSISATCQFIFFH